jgi:hypothetical protein
MKLKKPPVANSMDSLKRRRFLKILGAVLAAPAIDPAVRFAANDLAMGEAWAAEQTEEPRYLIEINLRDQWDFSHVFVPRGIATASNLRRGGDGRKCSLYYSQNELLQQNHGFYLTPGSQPLQRHLDSMAVIETCELTMGKIHGHEAANALRSPGRSYSNGAGRHPMFELDQRGSEGGNENHYTSSPTPVCLHNAWMKQRSDEQVRNAVAFKMGGRRRHTVYHCAAGLAGAEPDRFQTPETLLRAYSALPGEDTNIVPTADEADAISRLLKSVDERFMDRYGYSQEAADSHNAQVDEAKGRVYQGEPEPFDLTLSQEERSFWKQGVPGQVSGNPKANIWQQVAWAHKLVSNDIVRTVGLEFVYGDIHDSRPQGMLDTMMNQTVLPLTRLIDRLKEDGLYDRTLITMYSADGGRAPAANSSGNEGKNTVVMAGGMIRGGYYGDIRVAGPDGDGHEFSYHAPDVQTGDPRTNGAVHKERGNRLAGKHVWRTAARALGIPDGFASQFPDVQDGKVLDWMLRG